MCQKKETTQNAELFQVDIYLMLRVITSMFQLTEGGVQCVVFGGPKKTYLTVIHLGVEK